MNFIRRVFRWRTAPDPPLTIEEITELKAAFKYCEGDCPMKVVFEALIKHIDWQDKHLKNSKENYDK
jgi:hypothetical protein